MQNTTTAISMTESNIKFILNKQVPHNDQDILICVSKHEHSILVR